MDHALETRSPVAQSKPDHGTSAFFRQSGWLVIATVLGGVFMYAVHKVSARPLQAKGEYGVFFTLLQVFLLMQIPAIGLQTIFAQQTVLAITDGGRRQLTAAVRVVALVTFVIWFVMVGVVFGLQEHLIVLWKISNPAALWVTVVIGLCSMWLPINLGILQGRQNFLWLGWAVILNGVGRFLSITVIVWLLGGYAAGAMTGALMGVLAAMGVAFWHARDVWLGPQAPFDWRAWLARVLPLTLGLGASTFMMSADVIVVQSLFDGTDTGFYNAAGMIGRALVFLTAPLMTVMFPKVARSAMQAEKSDVLLQALGATALLGGLAALACTLLPTVPLRLIYPPSFLRIAPLVPWFAWCMLPLTVANVLINSLLARMHYRAVPWLVLVAAGYGLTLLLLSPTFLKLEQAQAFKLVVQVLGGFGLLLVGVAAWFTWGANVRAAEAKP
jgi:O-antigen/teichoic acid export membrane protein